MAESQLDAFLAQETGAPTPPPPAPPSEPVDPLIDPKGWAKENRAPPPASPTAPPQATPEAKAPEPKPEEDEADPEFSGDDQRTMPFGAFEKARRDWKSRFAAEQARNEELRRQLEEARKAQSAPAPQPAPMPAYQPPPDPNTDLVGYLQWQEMERKRELLNERLNISEANLREKMSEQDLNSYVEEFKQHAGQDRSLWDKLYSQPAPYQWLVKQIDRIRAQADIGDDPAAYRARIAAEERAKWEAELQQRQQPAPSPAAGLPPSLATARSVAGRAAPAWTGETSLEDVVAGIQNRKRRQ